LTGFLKSNYFCQSKIHSQSFHVLFSCVLSTECINSAHPMNQCLEKNGFKPV
jgi:hypothetical protein